MVDSVRSYFHRTSSTPLLNDTLGGTLDKASERWPDREAVVVRDQGVRLSFAALRQEVDRLAAGLIALGLAPGDRIGLWSPNRIEWVLTQYATAKAGLILVNINPSYRAAELRCRYAELTPCLTIPTRLRVLRRRFGAQRAWRSRRAQVLPAIRYARRQTLRARRRSHLLLWRAPA